MRFRKDEETFYTINRNILKIQEAPKKVATFSKFKGLTYETYKEFVGKLRNIIVMNKGSVYSLVYFMDDSSIVVGIDRMGIGKKIKLQFKYNFEKPEVKELIKEVFPFITDDGVYSSWRLDETNEKQNHLPISVIDVLMSAKMIELNDEEVFHEFTKRQENGKVRDIIAPHEDIKSPLRAVNQILTYAYDSRNIDFQVGYKKGKSIKDNAKIHQNNNFLVNVDIKSFYPSCDRKYVKKYIEFMFTNDPSGKMMDKFLNIILDDTTDALFLGNPISGTLANVIISKPVAYMKNMLSKCDMSFSVYADDISASSEKRISKKFIQDVFNDAFEEYGMLEHFKLNAKKTSGRSNHKRKVTGLAINHKNEVTIPRKYYKDLRVRIHKLSLGEYQNIDKLGGKIAHALNVDESGKVVNYLNGFKDTILKFKLVSEETINKYGLFETEQGAFSSELSIA